MSVADAAGEAGEPDESAEDGIATRGRVEVRSSDRHGRGVFATRSLLRGEVVERCPVLVVEAEAAEAASEALYGYVYDWDDGRVAVALGFGSLYNHGADPNAEYESDHEVDELVVRAVRTIAAGEEVTIDYTQGGVGELWFDPEG